MCIMFGRSSTRLLNICVSSFCKANQLERAETAIIDGIRLGVLPDVVTYNTLIDAYCRFMSFDVAYSVLYRMREAGINPDVVTYNSLIAGAARQCLLSKSFDLFEEMLRAGIHPDLWSFNTLMHCFFRLGRPDEANKVFRDIILCKDVSTAPATFNIVINGLCKNGYTVNALKLFRNLKRHGFVPQRVTYNILINGLCKAHRLGAALRILQELKESGHVPNAITYTTVLKCCFKSRRVIQALEMLSEMKNEGYTFDGFAYCTAVAALVKIGKMDEANYYMEEMIRNGSELDLVSYNTITNLYCKEGKLEAAYKLLEEMENGSLECDQYTHTIIINGLCKAGKFEDALQHLRHMNTMGFSSNLVALNCIVDGLGKSGQINQAISVFDSMEFKDSFTYTSMVNNLCKEKMFHLASKILLSCLRSRNKVLKSTVRELYNGLRDSGYTKELRKLKKKIQVARTRILLPEERGVVVFAIEVNGSDMQYDPFRSDVYTNRCVSSWQCPPPDTAEVWTYIGIFPAALGVTISGPYLICTKDCLAVKIWCLPLTKV